MDNVKDAVVIARPIIREHLALVAYLVAEDSDAIAVYKIRASLRQRLPDYMVPTRFVILDAFPTLPSGKIDRRRLPEPDDRRPRLSEPPLASRNNVECALTNIWERTLKITGIGVADNFFDLGGDSLLALDLFLEIERVPAGTSPRRNSLPPPRFNNWRTYRQPPMKTVVATFP